MADGTVRDSQIQRNATQIDFMKAKSVKVWHAVITLIPVAFIAIGVGFTYASNVDSNTLAVKDNKADIKELSEVKLDIHKLNVSNATLRNEVVHINQSQKRTESQIQETNLLLKSLIVESKESRIQKSDSRPPEIRYIMPTEQRSDYRESYAPQGYAPVRQRRARPDYWDQDRNYRKERW